jgi:hypothetical protein
MGQAGIGPKPDPEDFKGLDDASEGPAQGKLMETKPDKGAEEVVASIQNGKMAMHFIDYKARRAKDRSKLVRMRFSMDLEDGHVGMLPREIEDEWKHFKKGGSNKIEPKGTGAQNVEFSIAADKESDLEVLAAVEKAVISHIAKKGDGSERRVIRLEIHFLANFTVEVEKFCGKNFDETLWVEMEESQMAFDDGEAEEA